MTKQKYDLVGIDGNAYSIIGYVTDAMIREEYSKQEIDEYNVDAKSGDYSYLLRVSAKMIEKLNSES